MNCFSWRVHLSYSFFDPSVEKRSSGMKIFPALMILFLLASCGGTPFDEDYWDDDLSESEREETTDGRLSAPLAPVSALSFGSGEAIIDLNGNAADLRVEMLDVPQNVVLGQVIVTATPCQNFSAAPPTTGSTETRDFAYAENGTRAGLFSEITEGDTVEGKSLVVYAMTEGTPATGGTISGLFPLACGTLVTAGTTGTTPTTTPTTTTPTSTGTPTGFPTGTSGTGF